MKKRILSLVLALTLLCSLFGGFAVLAAKDDGLVSGNLLCNGDMELLGTPFGKWSTKAEYVSLGFARNGERSMKLKSDGRVILQQEIPGIVPGQKYTYTAYLYVKELLMNAKDVGGCLKIEFHREGEKEALTHIGEAAVFECFGGEKNKWVKCEISGIAPDEAVKAKLHLRMDCGGEIYWDDATFVGAVTPEDYEVIAAERDLAASTWAHSNELLAEVQAKEARTELAPGAINYVTNPSFEELSEAGDYPKNWTGFQSKWGLVTFPSNEEAHSGEYSAKIVATPETYQPWVMHTMQGNFIADSTYVLSAWVKAKEIEALNGVFMKAECYSSTNATGNTATGSAESSIHKFRDDDWHQIKLVFTMPQNTSVVKVYLRTSTGNAVVFYDDIEFGQAASLTVMDFLPKFTFNYTEEENIETSTTINYINNPIEEGSVVEYTVKDGENIIVQETVPAAANITWSFPTMKLAEKEKAYTISAVYKKADGTVIEESEERRIYRYDRPTMIDDQGRFLVDGKPLDIVYLYGAWEKYYADYAEAGITVIRPDDVRFDTVANIPEIRRLMDSAHEHGLKVIYQLYGKVAGHPLQIPTTKRLVTEFKDHPALLGWMMVDEPSYQILPGRQAQSYPEMLEYMEEGYKVIRAIDPHHPIYNLETVGVPDSYELAFQYVDIASVDLYPNDSTETTYTYKGVKRAVNAVHDEKEVWNLGYASDWDANYTPDADGLRMQNYMAIWAGASGFGYYACDEYTPYMLETLKQSNKSGERHQMFDHFVRGNSPVFDEYMGAEYWYRSWVDNQGKMYLLVKEHKNDGKNTEVNFNLKSTNGLIEINGYLAKLVNGTTEKTIASDDSSFKLTLTPTQISLYEILPNTSVDFSAITAPVYNDLEGYEWAEESIENITKNKIANNKGVGIYAPGENITRGDFAMYLMRALNFTDYDPSYQFDDVDPNAYYAKEIAIGKKLGILKGTGDNTYNPEEPISRQDLMVICARGLRHVRRISDADYLTAIANFKDKGLIADYATNDIGAMVSSRIITGNPDLTINPLGNTTRAEAAVIMDRITKQN